MKIKVIERLRAALEEERKVSIEYAVGSTAWEIERAAATARTEKLVAKIERMLQNAAESNAGGPIPRSHGGLGVSPVAPASSPNGGAVSMSSIVMIDPLGGDPRMVAARRAAELRGSELLS